MGLLAYRQTLISITCYLLMIDCGLQEGWSISEYESSSDEVNKEQSPWLTLLLYCGVVIGSIPSLFLMNKVGRKFTLVLACVPKILSWFLIAAWTNSIIRYSARIIGGIGCGMTYFVVLVYLSETTSEQNRGPLGILLFVFRNVGILLVYAIDDNLRPEILSILASGLSLLFLSTYNWLPESPVFYAKINQFSFAEEVLKWILVKEDVEEELEELMRLNPTKHEINVVDSFGLIYQEGGNKRAFRIVVILISGVTLVGIAPIMMFQRFIFDLNIYHESRLILFGTCELGIIVAGILSVIVVRILGKRILLLISIVQCVLSLIMFLIYLILIHDSNSTTGVFPFCCLAIYVLGYGFALNTIPFSYIGEVFSLDVRAPACMLFTIIYAFTKPSVDALLETIPGDIQINVFVSTIYFIPMLLFIGWLIHRYVPETEGKTLYQIQTILRYRE